MLTLSLTLHSPADEHLDYHTYKPEDKSASPSADNVVPPTPETAEGIIDLWAGAVASITDKVAKVSVTTRQALHPRHCFVQLACDTLYLNRDVLVGVNSFKDLKGVESGCTTSGYSCLKASETKDAAYQVSLEAQQAFFTCHISPSSPSTSSARFCPEMSTNCCSPEMGHASVRASSPQPRSCPRSSTSQTGSVLVAAADH